MYVPAEGEQNADVPAADEEPAAEEVVEVVPDSEDGALEAEPGTEDGALAPGMEETAETGQEPVGSAEAAQVEVVDPDPPGQKQISREAVGTPASKAKRGSDPRSRMDTRRRRPAARERDEKKKDEDQP